MLSPVPEARRSFGSLDHQTRQVGELVPPPLSPSAWLEQNAVDSLVQLVRSLPDFELMVASLVQRRKSWRYAMGFGITRTRTSEASLRSE